MYQISAMLLMPSFYDWPIFEKCNESKQIKNLNDFSVSAWALDKYAKGFSASYFVLKNSLSKTLLQKQNEEGWPQKDWGSSHKLCIVFNFFLNNVQCEDM